MNINNGSEQKTIKLTVEKDVELATKIANRLNKKFGDVAEVRDGKCYITKSYYRQCCDYVQEHCNVR